MNAAAEAIAPGVPASGTPRIRKAWFVTIRGYDGGDTVYAPTAGKARMQVWHSVDSIARIVDITVRRQPARDVALPARDPIADRLTEEETHCLLHAFGATCGDPTKAGYRDHFYTRRDDPPLVALTAHGLMKPHDGELWGKGMTYFILTAKGRHVALSLTPEYGR